MGSSRSARRCRSPPPTYFRHKAEQADPTRRLARAQRDDELCVEIQRVWDEHQQVYGPRKVWRQLRREKISVPHCRVRRLMRTLGLAGTGRGRAWITTTQPEAVGSGPPDLGEAPIQGEPPESALGV